MKKRIRRCDPVRRQQWQMAIQRWQCSGQSVRAFCQQEGLKESAFFFWRRELALHDRAVAASPLSSPRRQSEKFAAGRIDWSCGAFSAGRSGRGTRSAESGRHRNCFRLWTCGPRSAAIRQANAGRRTGGVGGPVMLSLSELVRIYVCAQPTDMRNYAEKVFMGSRPFPAQSRHASRVPGTIG